MKKELLVKILTAAVMVVLCFGTLFTITAQAKMQLPSALESSLRILKSKNPINRPFLHRVGSEVGRRRMIEGRDKS